MDWHSPCSSYRAMIKLIAWKEVRKMRKTIVLLGLVALMVLGVAYAYAQGPGSGPGHRPGWGQEKWSSLTPEQQTKFQELRRKFREDNAKLFGAIVTKRLELQSLWTDPKADSKAILDKEKELRDLQNQIKDKAVQMRLEARKFLTPEQIQNWKGGRGMSRGFGGGHMMGHGPGMGQGGMGPGHGMGPGEGCY
jgi:Spy/CpxP family protein refolding chaperone